MAEEFEDVKDQSVESKYEWYFQAILSVCRDLDGHMTGAEI